MRLMQRFLSQVGSSYVPGNLVKINNKRFDSKLVSPLELRELVYTGAYLGCDKQRFEPSSVLLQVIAGEETTSKAYVNRETAWLFVVGKDVFEENIQRKSGDVRLGGYCLVMFGDHCLGYGRYETSGDRRVIKNLFDVGNFLRRE